MARHGDLLKTRPMAGGTIEGGVVGPGGTHEARIRPSRRARRGTLTASVAASLLCVIALVATPGVAPLSAETVERVTLTLGVISKALFFGAGVVQLARWRISTEARDLYWGAALVVLGGMALPLNTLAVVIPSDTPTALLPPMTTIAIALVAAALVVVGLREPEAAVAASAWPVLTAALGTVLMIFGTLTSLHLAAPALMHTDAVSAALPRGVALSVVWASLALFRVAQRDRRSRPSSPSAALLGCLAVAELLRVVSVLHVHEWAIVSAALVVGVAGAASYRAFRHLTAATASEREALESAFHALDTARVVAELEHERQEEIEHDARNALAGLRAALLTIDRYGSRLDKSTMSRLRRAALGEVHQLEHLLVHDRKEPVVDFELDAVLSETVEARRARGSDVVLSTPALRVRGRPADLATSLGNLLMNAEQHGAEPISVRATLVGDHVEIDVADNGPGIDADRVGTVFSRGVKGNASGGNGLGLSVARALMRDQGGDVRLRSHTGGCVFTARIPVTPDEPQDLRVPVPSQRDATESDERLAVQRRGDNVS